MKRRAITGTHSMHEGVNATPLIDVVMCLIIFFLLVGKLASDRGAAVRLPDSLSGREEQSASVLVVTISPLPDAPIATDVGTPGERGWASLGVSVQADGQTLADARELEATVRSALAKDAAASIQLRADRDLPFGTVEPVLRACGNAGAKAIRFAAEKQQ